MKHYRPLGDEIDIDYVRTPPLDYPDYPEPRPSLEITFWRGMALGGAVMLVWCGAMAFAFWLTWG